MALSTYGQVLTLQLAARDYAVAAHFGQKRKYAQPGQEPEPYVEHPKRVAKTVGLHTSDPEVIAAAFLHDVIEDCGVSKEALADRFNPTVASYVWLLTNDKDKMLKRATRKAMERIRLGGSPEQVQLIKFADIKDNALSIYEHDKELCKVWFPEALHLCTSMVAYRGPLSWETYQLVMELSDRLHVEGVLK